MSAGVVIVELEGEFDLGAVDRIDATLASFQPSDDIVIDLRRTTFIDSVTLARLVAAARRQSTGGGRLVLAEASSSAVRRVLSITQLDRVLPYADTVEAAVDLLRGAPHPGAPSAT